MRSLLKLLLLTALGACGSPDSDAVFTKGNPKVGGDSARPAAAPPPRQAPRLVTKRYGGYYRRSGDELQFQPCGTRTPLPIIGSPTAQLMLRDTFRWNAMWEGRKMYGLFNGAIVTDTPTVRDSATREMKPTPRTRFFVADVDSVRTWKSTDCGGMRVP